MSGISPEVAPSRPARRSFFKRALLGGGVAVAAGLGANAVAAGNGAQRPAAAPKTRGGYRETAVVRQYYQLARQI